MKRSNRIMLGLAFSFAGTGPSMALDAQAIVQQQREGYNAHDIQTFTGTYDQNAEVFERVLDLTAAWLARPL